MKEDGYNQICGKHLLNLVCRTICIDILNTMKKNKCTHTTPGIREIYAVHICLYHSFCFSRCLHHQLIHLFSSFQTETYGSTEYTLCVFQSDGISFAAFHIIFFSSSYLIPLTLISGLYAFMLRLWRTVVPHNRTNESHRGRKRVTRLVFVVVAAFALLWLPIQVSSIKYA